MSDAPAAGGVRTTCPYCGVGCGVVARPDGRVAGDPDHPANRGRLCSKGAALAETLGAAGRILRPRVDGSDATWDAALDRIAAGFREAIERHGPDAVALYGSGQFLTEDYYVANKLMKGFVGTANLDTNSRLCMASSVAGHVRAFGEDVVPGRYEDIELADLVVLVGSNAAWCHPVLFQRLAAARDRRGGLPRVVVIDPRRTATCEIADLHLKLRAGSDVALFAGLLAHLAAVDAIDPDWVDRHAAGWDAALAAARETAPTPAQAATLCGLDVADVGRFYDWFAATARTVTLYSQGVNQSAAGTDKVNAILNCHLATGRIGRPGMGPLSLTGQPNAMGGREVGGLANQLAAHMSFADPADVDRVRRFWQAPRMARGPGLKAIELFEAVRAGRIRALWILATNPAASLPRGSLVREALAACPLVVVSDCWETDTTRFAHVVLPAAGWSEKDGTVTNSERRISRQRAFRAPPGEARPDWWALAQLGRRLGWADAFAWTKAAAIFREHAALSGFENEGRRVFDIGALAALDDAAYDSLAPVCWPLPHGVAPRASDRDEGRLFGDGRFPTPDGRARLVPTPWRPPVERADAAWPLLLNTGRLRDQWHTMTRTGLVPRLLAHAGEPALALHPADAARLGLADGGLARVESRHGEAVLRVAITDDQRAGEAFAPMHWTDRFASAGPIDRLVGAATDPVSGQPEMKATAIRVAPVATRWRALLLRRAEGIPVGAHCHWSRVPVATGHAYGLTGWSALPEGAASEAWVRGLLGVLDEADLVIYADPRRGRFRYASLIDGRLDACLFVAAEPAGLPARAALEAMLGLELSPEDRLALLAGGRPSAGGTAGGGPVVCACFAVGVATLRDAIRDHHLTSVAEIGAALQAGTNCGSCIPELKDLLRHERAERDVAAA